MIGYDTKRTLQTAHQSQLREASELKNVTKSGKSPNWGRGQHKKSNLDFSNFSKIQKSPKHPAGGGGGSRKLGTFSTFGDIF